jgi:hypothetical protein
MKKKIISLLLLISLVFTMTIPAFAAPNGDPLGYVTVSLDVNTLGDGYLFEPVKVPFYAGENYADVTDRFLGGSANYENTGELSSLFYLARVKLPRSISVNVPQIILDALEEAEAPLDVGSSAAGELLGEFDYSFWSGWMITVDNTLIVQGTSDFTPHDGEVCRWQFSVYGYGADLGQDNGWGEPPLYTAANKDALTAKVAGINSAANKAELLAKPGVLTAYNNAYAALTSLTAEQAQVTSALTALDTALNASTPPSSVDISTQLNATLAYLVSTVTAPNFGTGGGEWTVLTLARAGYAVPENYFEGYYSRIEAIVRESSGVLPGSSAKKTEYSRLILGLSSIGKDSTNVGGYDLTAWLSSMSKVQYQGLNGPVFALLALDTNNYGIPDIDETSAVTGYTGGAADQVTRQKLIDYILDKEIKKGTADAGGWALSGTTPDPDMTGMAMQALAPYIADTTVAAAVNRGVTALSNIQLASGGFGSWGTVNAESIAQTVVALTAVGVDPATDSRFVKANGNIISALLEFFVDGGGFRHTLGTAVNGMATDQAGYALVAYDRYVKGQNSLYDMTDAFDNGGDPGNPQTGTPAIILEAPGVVLGKANTTFNLIVKADGFPAGNYQLMDGIINIPGEFSVESVTPSNRLTGGTLAWNYSAADQKLRFVYTNTELNGIGLSGAVFPADLLTVALKVKADVDTALTPSADITAGGVTLKEASDMPAFVFDTSAAIVTIGFSEVGLSVRELFTGDGIDLIPADKRAVAVTLSGAPAGAKVSYKGTELIYSAEMTAKHGVETYVLFTTPAEAGSELLNIANYTLQSGSAPAVIFGDTDGNGIINAQDAVDVIAAWLRKTAVNADVQILQMNVTSDSRINTFDALAVMENYVSHLEFAIIGK